MSLRILFADDSVTAQNMGKKILTEAGYEVVAVSNGAAAVKKIAEQKPDIIILDVYMPGYSGLEVCEKVRSSMATIKTPVLLTVGKMEPYKPEEANRVRADGVIIKPFEASDLLAIVKKFEERIGETPAVAPPPPPPAREEFTAQAPETNHEPPPRVVQPMVEVPDHMASSSAFSDLLGTDATRVDSFSVPPVHEAVAPVVPEETATAAAPDYDVPAAWRPQSEPQPTIVETPVASVASAGAAAAARPLQIPVYQDPEPSQFEVVPTASAPVGDIEIPREAGLQENAHETTRNTVADHRDPDLVPTAHHIAAPQAAVSDMSPVPPLEAPLTSSEESFAIPKITPSTEFTAGAVETAETFVNPIRPNASSVSEADFEARVAAALAAYGQTPEINQNAPAAHEESVIHATPTADETQPLPVMDDAALEAAARNQEQPRIEAAPEFRQGVAEAAVVEEVEAPTGANTAPMPSFSAQPEFAGDVAYAAPGVSHEEIAARVEEQLPGAVEAVAQQTERGESEHDTIAQAVHRVMERMKENLVEEIVRELKSKK